MSYQKRKCDNNAQQAGGTKLISNCTTTLFVGVLTKPCECVLVCPLQPKSGFLPEAECGRPKNPQVEDGANGSR